MSNVSRYICLTALGALMSLVTTCGGGDSPPSPSEQGSSDISYRGCGTREVPEHELRQVEERHRTFTGGRRIQQAQGSLATNVPVTDLAIRSEAVTILVQFHVLMSGSSRSQGNVPEGDFDLLINALNTAFAGFRGGAGTAFRFAKAGPATRTTNGAWFTMGDGTNEEFQAKKALRAGGPRTLNFYTAGIAIEGWATFPWKYHENPYNDGVVFNHNKLPGHPTHTNFGMIAVHEVGHWLGLYHVYQGGCANLDQVADTPAQQGFAGGMCPDPPGDSCPADPGLDPIHNYMNQSSDECLTEFTGGQAERMEAMFVQWRDTFPDDIALVGGSGSTTLPYAASNGTRDGTFTPANPPATDFAAKAALAGVTHHQIDFDNDGRGDFALLGASSFNNTIPIARANNTGGFTVFDATVTTQPEFPTWARFGNVKRLVGDFNRDGRGDLALTGPSGWSTLPVAFSNGGNTFRGTNLPITDFAVFTSVSGAVPFVGDFDVDGRSDIAVTGPAHWNTMPIAFSQGDGRFLVRNGFVGDFAAWSARSDVTRLIGDFDGNGGTDVALTGVSGWNTLPVASSTSTSFREGTWRVHNNPIGSNFASLAATAGVAKLVGDFNRDGLADIALTGGSGWTKIYVAFSLGGGNFDVRSRDVTDFPLWASMPGAVKLVGDFDRDGRADIALTGVNGWATLPVAYSNGDGTFEVKNAPLSTFPSQAASNARKYVGQFRPSFQ